MNQFLVTVLKDAIIDPYSKIAGWQFEFLIAFQDLMIDETDHFLATEIGNAQAYLAFQWKIKFDCWSSVAGIGKDLETDFANPFLRSVHLSPNCLMTTEWRTGNVCPALIRTIDVCYSNMSQEKGTLFRCKSRI